MTDFLARHFDSVLSGVFLIYITYMSRNISKIKTHYRANQKGTMALLQNEIIKAHKKCMKQGWCHSNEKKNIFLMHEQYKILGGNGFVEKMISDIMKLNEYEVE